MLSGIVLSQWLQRRVGTVLSGSSIRLSPSGLLRVSTAVDSHQVQVMLPVLHDGQAAVARVVPPGADGPALALRVQAISSDEERARQMERLVAMLTVAEAARADPPTYPAVLPVLESFTLSVPSGEITTTGSTTAYELWCDVVAWLPTTLASHHTNTGPTARDPSTVATQILPVLTTVRAVHDNLGIVHRDITPSNVLVSPDRRLALADWAVARAATTDASPAQTRLAVQPGLPVPPEMITGGTSVDRRTDAWYLGSLLVWMLTGQPADPHGRPPEGLPAGPVGHRLATIAQGLCWPDPHQRMGLPEAVQRLTQPVDAPWVPATSAPAASAVAPPLADQRFVGPQPPDARPAPSLPPDSKSHALRTTVLLGIATLVFGVATGVVWNMSNRNQPTATSSQSPTPSSGPSTEPYL